MMVLIPPQSKFHPLVLNQHLELDSIEAEPTEKDKKWYNKYVNVCSKKTKTAQTMAAGCLKCKWIKMVNLMSATCFQQEKITA